MCMCVRASIRPNSMSIVMFTMRSSIDGFQAQNAKSHAVIDDWNNSLFMWMFKD